ncbi:hypothetical protein WJ973_26715 [Achromobacter xylosoxidans]
MAALLFQVVGLGLDDARRQPQAVDPVAHHLAQQFARQLARVAIEKGIGQRLAGAARCLVGLARHGVRRSVRRSAFR